MQGELEFFSKKISGVNTGLYKNLSMLEKIPGYFLIKAKQKARSEASRQNYNKKYFDAKLRFALFASLRSAIFSDIQVNN